MVGWSTYRNKNEYGNYYFKSNKRDPIELLNRFRNVTLFILDEVSMLGLEDLYELSQRLKEIMLLLYIETTGKEKQCNDKIEYIKNTPFGGLHIILSGDLYQLNPVKRTSIYAHKLKQNAILGRHVWNEFKVYSELQENPRFDKIQTFYKLLSGEKNTNNNQNTNNNDNNNQSLLSKIAHNSRIGKITDTDILHLNTCVISNLDEFIGKQYINTNTLWLAPTNKQVREINDNIYKRMIINNPTNAHFTIAAQHKRPNFNIRERISLEQNKNLLKLKNDQSESYLKLTIGTRVIVQENIATPIGIYYKVHTLCNNILILLWYI